MASPTLSSLIKSRSSSPVQSLLDTASVVSGISAASRWRRQKLKNSIKREPDDDYGDDNDSRSMTATSGPNVLSEFLVKRKKLKTGDDEGKMDQSDRDDDIDDDVDDNKSLLAISFRRGNLGAAHFSPVNGTLYLLEDVQDGSDRFELARLLVFQVQPDTVLCHPRVDESFLGAIRECVAALPNSPTAPKKCVEVRPSTEFLYRPSLSRILGLGILEVDKTEPHGSDESPSCVDLRAEGEESQQKLSARVLVESIVSLENIEMVGCAGALLSYISRNRVLRELEGNHEEYTIRTIEQYSLAMHMRVNQTTLSALQIFQDEAHPNLHSSRKKEGLSLFGILNRTLTPNGSLLLKNWFLRPSMDVRVINNRLDTIEFFLHPQHQAMVLELRGCLQNIKNIPKILHHMKTRTTLLEWQAVLKFSFFALKITTTVESFGARGPDLVEAVKPQGLREVGSLINNIVTPLKTLSRLTLPKVDFSESLKEDRIVVRGGVDNELDELKRTYDGMDDLLLGYLITLPFEDDMNE
ncbi:MutS protein msh5 [Dinochytrium kinnereticum]|nr:MutS protein msh5 [Dinochytrium kinnereticum]